MNVKELIRRIGSAIRVIGFIAAAMFFYDQVEIKLSNVKVSKEIEIKIKHDQQTKEMISGRGDMYYWYIENERKSALARKLSEVPQTSYFEKEFIKKMPTTVLESLVIACIAYGTEWILIGLIKNKLA